MTDFGRKPETERFGIVPAFVLRERALKPGPKALYASLCCNADARGRLWRSLNKLAEEFDVTRRQIQRWLIDLEAAGVLVRLGARGHSQQFLVIRDPAGRGWARSVSLKNVIHRNSNFARHGAKGAMVRHSVATAVSSVADIEVPVTATPVSPKHDLTNKPLRTKEEARQVGVGGGASAPCRHLYGLKRAGPKAEDEAAAQFLNAVAQKIGWDQVVSLEPEQVAELIVEESGGTLTTAQAFVAACAGERRQHPTTADSYLSGPVREG